jgi:pyrroline-5-carboxylate reductase
MAHSVLIIGGGNMGGAIAFALHRKTSKKQRRYDVTIVEPDRLRCDNFENAGMQTVRHLSELSSSIDTIILAVKPQQFAQVASDLKSYIRRNNANHEPLVISIMAGVPYSQLENITRYFLP